MPNDGDWRDKQIVVTIGGAQLVGYLRKGGTGEGPQQCKVCRSHRQPLTGLRWDDREQVIDVCSDCLADIRRGNVAKILSTR